MGNSVNVPYNSNVAVCKLDMDRCMRRKIRRFIIDSSTNRSTNDTQSGRETTFASLVCIGRSRVVEKLLIGLRCLALMYRVTHLVANLGWVDFDLGCSTILLGQ